MKPETSETPEASASPPNAPAEDQAPAYVPLPGANDPVNHPVNEDPEQRRADAIVDVARAYLKHRPRTLGSGYELVVVTTKEQLEHGSGGVGGFLRDGTPVPLQVACSPATAPASTWC